MEEIQLWITEHLPMIISYAVIFGEAVGILLLKLGIKTVREKFTAITSRADKNISALANELKASEIKHNADIERIERKYHEMVAELKKVLISNTQLISSGKARRIADIFEKTEVK